MREIHHRRRRCSALGGVQSRDDGAKEAGRQVEADSLETITWPEFVGAFLPLKSWEEGKRAARHRDKTKDEPEQCSPADDCGWDNGLLPDADDEEMELIQLAFAVRASGVQGRSGGVTATLTELRAASAELDGVVPPEEPIRKALRVSQWLYWNDAGRRAKPRPQARIDSCTGHVEETKLIIVVRVLLLPACDAIHVGGSPP